MPANEHVHLKDARWEDHTVVLAGSKDGDADLHVWVYPCEARAAEHFQELAKDPYSPVVLFRGTPLAIHQHAVRHDVPLLTETDKQMAWHQIHHAPAEAAPIEDTVDSVADLFAEVEKDDYWVMYAVFPPDMAMWQDDRWGAGKATGVKRWGTLCFTDPKVRSVYLVGRANVREGMGRRIVGFEYRVVQGDLKTKV